MKKTTAKNHTLTSARTKRCICMILSILLIYTLLCVPIPVKAAEEEIPEKVVRVGSFEDTFNYVNEKGIRKGYGYELLETLAGYTGWKFEYVPCSWEDCFKLLQNGEIDLIGDISYQKERTEDMLFSDMPMGEEKYYLYADLNNTDISFSDLKMLNGKKIGVLKGSQPEKMLTEWEQKYGLNTEHVNITGSTDVEKMLSNHEIDCFVSLEESIWAGQGISTVSCIGKSDIYFAINKERTDIKEELDSAMYELEEERPFYSAELYKRYFSINYEPAISKDEKAWLEEHGAIRMGFLNNMSHDIRTPMNVILGYNQLMKEGLTDPKLLDYQKKIELSGKLLLSIINNVLDMAHIESGKMEIDENIERMGDILEEVDGVFASAAKEKNIQIKSEMHVTHKNVVCDGTKIREILSNLVSNALKYTPDGGTVTIKVQELPGDKEGYVKIKTEVADTGIGMSKDYIPIMFDSFSRERNTTIGKVSGTGLGMSIVKRMVDMMGGTIEVESEPGKGSCFTVILQHRLADEICEEKKPCQKQDVPEKILKGKRILLAEDNDLNAEITMTILENEGLLIDRVEDGVQCVDQIDQMPAGTYDLILMDVQMPNMDGYQTTKRIRQFADKEKANIPIIAMTANAFQEDVQASLDAGMNAHIAKPVDTQILKETIARYQ